MGFFYEISSSEEVKTLVIHVHYLMAAALSAGLLIVVAWSRFRRSRSP